MSFLLVGIVVTGAFAAGLFSGLTGFGTGLIAFGIWLHVVPAKTAAILVLWCSTVGQLTSLYFMRKSMDLKRSLPFIVPGLLLVPVGGWLLTIFEASFFKTVVGFVLIAFVIALLLAGRITLRSTFLDRVVDPFIGGMGGLMGGFSGLSGLLVTLWCVLRGWNKDQQRSVYQPFNLAVLSFSLIVAMVNGLIDLETLLLCLMTVPFTFMAVLAGVKLYSRVNNDSFRLVILVFLLLSGVGLVLPSWI